MSLFQLLKSNGPSGFGYGSNRGAGFIEQLSTTGRVVMLSSAAHTQASKGGIEFDNLDSEQIAEAVS